MDNDLLKGCGLVFMVFIATITVTALGIYFLWPAVVPIILPRFVEEGYVAATINPDKALLLSILCSFLFKGITASKS